MGKFLESLASEAVLYCRQLAWLNAIPDKPQGDKSTTQEPSRLKRMEGEGLEPDLPDCTAFHLISYLFDVGPVVPAGMSSGAISHSEIEAWQRNTGIELDAWESTTLRRLSKEYAAQASASNRRECPPPYSREEQTQSQREVVANKFRSFINAGRVKKDDSRST